MKWVGVLLAWVLSVGVGGAHEITFSHVDVRLTSADTRIGVQLPIKALLHEEPMPLPAGATEQDLRATPLRADVQASLAKLLNARLRLKVDGRYLPLRIGSIQATADDVALTATAPPVRGALDVEANLFPDDTLHKVYVDVYRAEALAGQYALDRQDPAFTLALEQRPLREVVATFVREGIHHIFIGQDHILFVLALVLLGGSLWCQARIVTAFTVAHSVTLALATLDILRMPSRLVESTIALSIVVVGLHDLRQLRRDAAALTGRDLRVWIAFVFGLVHGFGFASVLSKLDLPRQGLAWSLAAFNIGVEIGQLAIVLAAAPLVLVLGRYAPPRVARALLSGVACVVVLAGGFWFCQRAFSA